MKLQLTVASTVLGVWVLATGVVRAGEVGHYAAGVASIRDFTMPEPGFYASLFNYYYTTDRLNDRHGDRIDSITVGKAPGTTLNLNLDVDVYAVAPIFTWVSDWKVAGAKYAAYIMPNFSKSSVGASLSAASGQGINADNSTFGMNDPFIQPLWLGWSLVNWDFALGYGFYAPIGRYDTEMVTLPDGKAYRAESTDNVGLGFWTHQAQGAAYWYPWADKSTAVGGALTYEVHGNKDDFDFTPGQDLTLNWGASRIFSLTADSKHLLEIGPAGYSSWQITDDSGADAGNPKTRDQVHAVGGKLGFIQVPQKLSVQMHGFYEYYAEDRFQGMSLSINIAKSF